MLEGVEAVLREKRVERFGLSIPSSVMGKKAVEKALCTPQSFGPAIPGRAETLEIRALRGRQRSLILAKDRWKSQVIILIRQNRALPGEEVGKRAALVDCEIVDHRFHSERHAARQSPADREHQRAQIILRFHLARRIEDKTHSSARHATQHPEAPECRTEFLANLFDQSLCIEIAGPGNDRLQWSIEVALRRTADGL